MALSQIYKDQLVLGLEPYKLPVLFNGGIVAVKVEFSNEFVTYYGGELTPFTNEVGVGEVYGDNIRLRINQARHVQISLPYFPNSYQLEFLSSEWLRGREFKLIVWEYT